ncbi:MAG: threonine synthase, partial [Chloroflexota bacterium]
RLTDGETLPFQPDAYTPVDAPPGPEGDPPVLDVQYDYEVAGRELRKVLESPGGRRDVFRWLPLLPVDHAGSVLPAGGTPLVEAPRLARRLGLKRLYLKDETRNPTRCLKDRATAVGVTMALAQGHSDVYCASAGNAAISLAGFAAHAGLACHAYVPSYASRVRLAWLHRYGANVHVSAGNYDDAYAEAEADGSQHGWYSRNCALNPFLVEGKKTAALEIGEELAWNMPDWVVAPSGDGCTLGAIGKGFRELVNVGFADGTPPLIGAQSEAVQPLVRRFRGEPPAGEGGDTDASSIAVREPRNGLRLLNEVRDSGGDMVAVPDAEIATAQKLLATEAGMVAEFTSAATLAALMKLAESRSLEGQTAVLVITGGRLDDE